MPSLTIRNLSKETHHALRARAAQRGISTEAEIRDILERAVKPAGRLRLGSLLAAIGREADLRDEDVEIFQRYREPKNR